MLTYEDMTKMFLEAASNLGLIAHPEYWMNARSLEREFSCTCHTGHCEEEEQQSSCLVSFTWGVLDTALSIDGPLGVCEFFHEPEAGCLHLHTNAIPPLVLDLSYSLALNGTLISDETLLSLAQLLKLHASEHSRRTTETRPGVSMILREGRLYPDMLNLQQRVEIPIWHPLGMRGLHEEPNLVPQHELRGGDEIIADEPHPEGWLPQVMVEVCQDIMHVLAALDATVSYNASDL